MQNHENQIVLEVICHTVKPFWRYKKHVLCLSNGATPKCTEKGHHYWSIHTPPKTKKHECHIIMAALNRAFSLTWPASMQIHWNKRKRLHKKRVQLPQDGFGTPTWPPFHCFGTPIGSFSNDVGDGNEDFKKSIGLLRKRTTLYILYFFVHLFTVLARLRRENA